MSHGLLFLYLRTWPSFSSLAILTSSRVALRLKSLPDPAFKAFWDSSNWNSIWLFFHSQTFPLYRTVLNSNLASPEVWIGTNIPFQSKLLLRTLTPPDAVSFSKIITDPFSICNYRKKSNRTPYWAKMQ